MATFVAESEGHADELQASVPRQCPRCAYDLVGVIASWKETCPLHGTCSECGLEFKWRDIFDDRLSGPPWSFEHSARWSWRRLALTLWRATGFGRIWREIRMEIPIVSRRLVAIPVVMYLVYHLAVSLAALVDVFSDASMVAFMPWHLIFLQEVVPAVAWPYGRRLSWFDGTGPLLWLAWVGMQWLFMPLMMLVLDETFRRVRVRRVHILRGACYSAVAAGVGTLLAIGVGVAVFLGPAVVFRTLAPVGRTPMVIMILLTPTLWLTVWWYRFIKVYLRLPSAGVVTIVLMGVSVFASFTFMFAGSFMLD